MQFFGTVAALAAALSLASAQSGAPAKFLLKTVVTSGQQGFNNLYVYPSHTGAGINTVLVGKKTSSTPYAYLNDTYLNFELSGIPEPYKFLFLEGEDTYTAWNPCQINGVTGATKGFFINEEGHLDNNNKDEDFGGWRVCQWNHGQPEVFHNVKGFKDANPISCAIVDLVPLYAP